VPLASPLGFAETLNVAGVVPAPGLTLSHPPVTVVPKLIAPAELLTLMVCACGGAPPLYTKGANPLTEIPAKGTVGVVGVEALLTLDARFRRRKSFRGPVVCSGALVGGVLTFLSSTRRDWDASGDTRRKKAIDTEKHT
jgi:hypothetical protein